MKRTYKPKPGSVLEWEGQHRYCFLCGGRCMSREKPTQMNAGLVTHHIQRRGTSHKPYQDHEENLMRLCWIKCHEMVEHWPAARQLALKWVHDKAGHDNLRSYVCAWLLIYDPLGKAPNRLTVDEVEHYLPIIDPRRAHLPPLPR